MSGRPGEERHPREHVEPGPWDLEPFDPDRQVEPPEDLEREEPTTEGTELVSPELHGEESDRVRAAQEQLALLGFDPGDVDGVYGPATRAAVEAFEESESRLASQADGNFGPLTWRLLFKTRP